MVSSKDTRAVNAQASAAVQNGKQAGQPKEGFDAKRGRFYQAGITGVQGGIGVPGTGKTTLILEKLWPAQKVIIYDQAADFGHGPRQKPLPGFHHIFDISTLADWVLKAKAENWPNVRICFTPLARNDKSVILFKGKNVPIKYARFRAVCDLVKDFGDCIFFVDEIWNFQTPSSSPEELEEIFCQWRHYGVCLMWTAQIAQNVDKALLSMSTELYVGRLNLQNDLDAVRRNGRIPDDALALIPNLPDWEFVHRFEDGSWKVERG